MKKPLIVFLALIAFAVFMLVCLALICRAEEDFFEPFGFQLENESGMKMKILWDEPNSKLVFRMMKSETEYYEGMVDLIQVHEGEVIP